MSPPFQEREEAGHAPPLTPHLCALPCRKTKLNVFPRSERPVLDPRSIRTFLRQNRRKNSTKPQETVPEKCRCFGVQFCSFTSRKSIHLRFARALRESKKRAAPGISGAARLVSCFDSQGCGSQRPTLRRRPQRPTSRAGRCCRGCAGSSCGSPRARTRTGRACRPPRRPRHRSRTAGR